MGEGAIAPASPDAACCLKVVEVQTFEQVQKMVYVNANGKMFKIVPFRTSRNARDVVKKMFTYEKTNSK